MPKNTVKLDLYLNFEPIIKELKDLIKELEKRQEKMTYEEYKKELEITKQLLDLIDIETYFDKSKDARDIMDAIEDDFVSPNEKFKEAYAFLINHYSTFQGYVFNVMDTDEFVKYCKNRYPQYLWTTEVIERTYIYGKKEQ